jgi:hypothetical protein
LLWFSEKKEALYPVFRLRDVIHASARDEGGKMDLFLAEAHISPPYHPKIKACLVPKQNILCCHIEYLDIYIEY